MGTVREAYGSKLLAGAPLSAAKVSPVRRRRNADSVWLSDVRCETQRHSTGSRGRRSFAVGPFGLGGFRRRSVRPGRVELDEIASDGFALPPPETRRSNMDLSVFVRPAVEGTFWCAFWALPPVPRLWPPGRRATGSSSVHPNCMGGSNSALSRNSRGGKSIWTCNQMPGQSVRTTSWSSVWMIRDLTWPPRNTHCVGRQHRGFGGAPRIDGFRRCLTEGSVWCDFRRQTGHGRHRPEPGWAASARGTR